MSYMSVREAAKLWGYSEATIRDWCRRGIIKVTKVAEKKNGHWQIPADAQCPKKIKA